MGCVTGGEAGLTFAGRGVVYSIAPYPVVKTVTTTSVAKATSSTDSTSTATINESATGKGLPVMGQGLDVTPVYSVS